jgi:hypothetical protein
MSVHYYMHYFHSLTILFSLCVNVRVCEFSLRACVRQTITMTIDKDNFLFNPFTAEVAIMRLLGSAPRSHLCDQKRRSRVTGLSDLMTLFIDLACLYCQQTQRAFNVFKNTLNWLKIDSVDQKFNWLEWGNFSADAGTPGTERVIAFSQLAVKGVMSVKQIRKAFPLCNCSEKLKQRKGVK